MGVIPRAAHSIFARLQGSALEFSVSCSFLELYNEDLADLLVESEASRKPLSLFETGSGVVCQNLEEVTVDTPGALLALIERAQVMRSLALRVSARIHAHVVLTLGMPLTGCDRRDRRPSGRPRPPT